MEFTAQIFYFVVLVFSAIIHEYSHGWMADRLGDPTARYAGRLTLNPMAHLDPVGSILMPLLLWFMTSGAFLFAYAKPVPFNTYNLRDQRKGPAFIALAGPLSNLLLAVVFGLLAQFLPVPQMRPFFEIIVYTNVLLCIFNLVPIPPLDGSKLLFAILPPSMEKLKMTLERMGPLFLLVFIFAFFHLITPIIKFVFEILIGQSVLFG